MMDDRIIFGSDSAVIDSRYRTRAEASLKLGRDIVSHDPFFSCAAAFLLDAMAALLRKSAPASWAAITFPFSRPTWPSERGRPQPE
jgi:hypothetical protein